MPFFNELYKAASARLKVKPNPPYDEEYYRTERTVVITAPRQTGKTTWLLQMLQDVPESVLVVKDQDTRSSLLKLLPRTFDRKRVKSKGDFWVDNGSIPLEAERNRYSLLMVDDHRVIRAKESGNWVYGGRWGELYLKPDGVILLVE